MRKALLLAALSLCAAEAFSQVQREAAFRSKYELKEVVVMSRHNIRSPLTSGGGSDARDAARMVQMDGAVEPAVAKGRSPGDRDGAVLPQVGRR